MGWPWSYPIFFYTWLSKYLLALFLNCSLMASHLLTTMMMGLPCSTTCLMRVKSSTLNAEKASIINTTTCDYRTWIIVLIWAFRRYSSSFYFIRGVFNPAVSISSILRFLYNIFVDKQSLVVWATYDTIIFYSPNSSFIKDDLPTFGLPIKHIFIEFFKRKFFISTPRFLLLNASYGRISNYYAF